MTDTEKVIKGLEYCAASCKGAWDDNNACPYLADFIKLGADHNGRCVDLLCADALALLKSQEPIEARLHLCESCTKEFPECEATVDDMEFGCGVGNDNIIGCAEYVNRWKAQEPMAIKNSAGNGICPGCGHIIPAWSSPNYCGYCGQAVRWDG